MNDLIENPFAEAAVSVPKTSVNVSTTMVEQTRAMSEVQGMMLLAKQFPRDEFAALSKIITACQRPDFAEKAMYSYPRSGQTIAGPSIRLAEEIARCWGNLDFGIKELSQKDGESEMMAFAWDLETNVRSSQNFCVRHVRDNKNGPQRLASQRDIYENNANNAGRRLRARILAIIPPDIVNQAVAECNRTLAGNNSVPVVDRAKNLMIAFGKIGVSKQLIEKRLGHAIENITAEEVAEYRGIYNSLKDGITNISAWFDLAADGEKAAALSDKLNSSKETENNVQ